MKDKRKEVIQKLRELTPEEIDGEFDILIRETMDDNNFWNYIRSWKDITSLVDEMNDWDTDTKIREMANIKANFLK